MRARRAGRVAAFVVAAAAVWLLVVPQVREGISHLDVLGRVRPGWIVAGVGLEALSFLAYGLFTRSVLPPLGRPKWHWLLRADVFGAGLTHVLPGGGATASALRFRLLRQGGVRGADAALGSALQGIGSALVINLLLLISVLLVLPTAGGNPLYVTGAVVGVALLSVAVGLVAALTLGREHGARAARRVGVRLGGAARGDAAEDSARRASARIVELSRRPGLLLRATGWAAANWLLDAASLWVFLDAFGHRVPLVPILVAFSLANTLAVVPITPGGLGVIEGILIPSLVGFHTPRAIAVVGVLAWRLCNFWAPIPAGALSWVSLRLGRQGLRPPVSG